MKKEIRFGLVMQWAEKQALRRLAEAEGGLSLAATLRRLIRREAGERGVWDPESRSGQESGEVPDD